MGMSHCTATKERHFEDIARMHINMCRGIIRRHAKVNSEYTYLDLYAGSGSNELPSGQIVEGSPVVMARALIGEAMARRGFVFEKSSKNAAMLRERLTLEPAFHVVNGDHAETVDDVIRWFHEHPDQRRRFGFIYCDPNGTRIPVAVLRKLYGELKTFDTIDCVTYISATVAKRIRGVFGEDHWPELIDDLRAVGKKHIHVRVPEGHYQWTMAILTNYESFPELTRQGFYPLCSEEGQQLVRYLTSTVGRLQAEGWKKPTFISEMQRRYAEMRDIAIDVRRGPKAKDVFQPSLPLFEEM